MFSPHASQRQVAPYLLNLNCYPLDKVMDKLMEFPVVVGCFELHKESGERWKVRNTLTRVEHRTYGTYEEVLENLQKQSTMWVEKFAHLEGKLKKSSHFRNRINGSVIAAKAKKAKEFEALTSPSKFF